MAANPPLGVPLVLRPPTRLVPTEVTLAATGNPGSTLLIPGSNARMDRIQFVITVMDAALYLDLQTVNGQNFGAAFAQRPLTLETNDDILVSNPNAATVLVRIGELYPGTGNNYGVPRAAAPGAPGAPSGGPSGGGSGGGTPSGGATGGTSFGGSGSGSGSRNAQTP